MKAIMFASPLCPDCREAFEALDARGLNAQVEKRLITEDLSHLKEFLAARETAAFAPVKAAGGIGIPAFVFEDGSVTFDLEEELGKLG